MTTPSEKYQKIIRWLLSNINPETKGIQSSTNLLVEHHASHLPPLTNAASKDLVEVLSSVRAIEERIVALSQHLLPAWTPPPMSESSHGTISSITEESSFEKVFARLLPCIDASLSVTEESICAVNDGLCRISLEPIPPADANETAAKRQVRFVDKAKRININLALVAEALPSHSNLAPGPSDPVARPGGVRSGGDGVDDCHDVRLLYQPPAWSVRSQQFFCLELREGDMVLHEFPLSGKGHFLIGRLPICDVVIDDATCSRQHAVIQFRPGDPDPATGQRKDEVYIYDLGSTSGTYVNGMALQPSAYYPLFVADLLQFGQYPLSFMLRQRAASPPSRPPSTSSQTFYPSSSRTPSGSGTTPGYIDQPAPSPLVDEDSDEDELGPVPSHQGMARRQAPTRANTTPIRQTSSPPEEPTSSLSNINRLLSVSVGKQSAVGPPPTTSSSPSQPAMTSSTPSPAPATSSPSGPTPSPPAPSSPPSHASPAVVENAAPSSEANSVPFAVGKSMSEPPAMENKAAASPAINPRNPNFNEEEYKQKMLEAYERQQAENAEILRKRKEREAAGLPPLVEIPFVPERPRRNTAAATTQEQNKKKKKRWWNR